MNTSHPYEEKRFDNGLILREFKHNANVDDLIWHQDKKDRKVFVVESNGWKLQLSNGLPFPLIEGKEYFIPKKSWHRVIKGNGNLKIKIHERDDKMQILESQHRQHIRFLLKEEVYGTIATVYHGSEQPPEDFLKIFETGDLASYASTNWKPGKGAGSLYGHGLYSVWMKTSHQTFRGKYGDWIYKLKVNLYGFIIFDDSVCQKVYGKSITPLEQMKLIGKEKELRKASKEEIRILSQLPIKSERSSDLAEKTSGFLKGRVNGLVFFGSNVGPVVLVYDPDIATPIAWTQLDKTTNSLGHWTPWNASEIKQSLSRASHAGTHANSERLQSKSFDVEKFINNENAFKVRYVTLSDENKNKFALGSKNGEILTKLSKDKNQSVRWHVAGNPNTPSEVLVQLAGDSNHGIRGHVAGNPNTPSEVLVQLAKDTNERIREVIAMNPNISLEAFYKLFEDKKMHLALAMNPKAPQEVLIQLSKSRNFYIRDSVAKNPNTPVEILTKLAGDHNGEVRAQVAENPNTPVEILTKLAAETHPMISSRAARTLNSLQSLNELKHLINYYI